MKKYIYCQFLLWSVFTWRHGSHIGVPRQWNGGHVGVPNQSFKIWTLFWCKHFLLFQYICIADGHVSENALHKAKDNTNSVEFRFQGWRTNLRRCRMPSISVWFGVLQKLNSVSENFHHKTSARVSCKKLTFFWHPLVVDVRVRKLGNSFTLPFGNTFEKSPH